jgi:hypothetical protein
MQLRLPIKNTKLRLLSVFALFVLIFSVIRGFVPLLAGNASLVRLTYNFSFILGILFSLFGLYSVLSKKNQIISKQLRLLLLANFVLYIFWWFPVIVFSPSFNFKIAFFYTGLFPFAIIGFAKLPEKYLITALKIISVTVAGSVIWEFLLLNTNLVLNGYNLAMKYQLLLRPENFEVFGRTAGMMRPVGILGHRPHDAANLLAILSVYWVAMLFRKSTHKISIYIISVISISAMLMTQSASNILAFFMGIFFIMSIYRRKLFKFTSYLYLLYYMLILAGIGFLSKVFLGVKYDFLFQWLRRTFSGSVWADMVSLGITNIGKDLLVVFTGHGSSLGFSSVGNTSEIAFIKMLVEFGLITWIVIMIILIYPVWCYALNRSKDKQLALPYIVGIIVGVVSLWHYGSVLRTTNIFVFFALHACALKIFANERINKIS